MKKRPTSRGRTSALAGGQRGGTTLDRVDMLLDLQEPPKPKQRAKRVAPPAEPDELLPYTDLPDFRGKPVKEPLMPTAGELADAAWRDIDIFGRTFFENSFRMPSAAFHKEIDRLMDTPGNRYVGVKVFRGGAKTTRFRVKLSQRISYGVTRTAMVISRSMKHGVATISWLHRNVEYNKKWASFYGLRPGKRWSPGEGDIEIFHERLGHPIRVIAAGIEGQVRGFNFDDWRPDFIGCDDIDNEETTKTVEQRQKTAELLHGAIANSLTPASENPWAQLVFLQTPLHKDDQIETVMRDPTWATAEFGCFTKDGRSRWPERWTTKELKAKKAAHIARNQLYLWMREWECSLVQAETKAFRMEWLKYWDTLPEKMAVYIGVDPATSAAKWASYQAVAAVGVSEGRVFLLEYTRARGEDPEQLITNLFRMHKKYGGQVRLIGVESVGYQKTLQWYIEQAMKRTQYWMSIVEVKDRREKAQRIRDSIRDIAFNGQLYVRRDHKEFIEDYADFEAQGESGGVKFPDLLDAFSMALKMINPFDEGSVSDSGAEAISNSYRPLRYIRRAP